jgi:hypothetical protein
MDKLIVRSDGNFTLVGDKVDFEVISREEVSKSTSATTFGTGSLQLFPKSTLSRETGDDLDKPNSDLKKFITVQIIYT